MFKSFRTYELASRFYKECQKLEVRGAIKNQLDRASLSIPLNLAEGRGRRTLTDQKHFSKSPLVVRESVKRFWI